MATHQKQELAGEQGFKRNTFRYLQPIDWLGAIHTNCLHRFHRCASLSDPCESRGMSDLPALALSGCEWDESPYVARQFKWNITSEPFSSSSSYIPVSWEGNSR